MSSDRHEIAAESDRQMIKEAKRGFLAIEFQDLLHSLTIAEQLVEELIIKNQTILPMERLKILRKVVAEIEELEIPTAKFTDSSWVAAEKQLQDAYEVQIQQDPTFMQQKKAQYLAKKITIIRDYYKSLLEKGISAEQANEAVGIKARPGLIPVLEAAIARAEDRFDHINTELREKYSKAKHKITDILKEADQELATTKTLPQSDEIWHYTVLLEEFVAKLQANIALAQQYYNEQDFAADHKVKNLGGVVEVLNLVRKAIANVSAITELEPDAMEHYLALLQDRRNHLEGIIKQAIIDFQAYGFDRLGPLDRLRAIQEAQFDLDNSSTLLQFTATRAAAPLATAVQPAVAAAPAEVIELGQLPKVAMQ